MVLNGKNGDRIWKFRKSDILFVVSIGIIIYGAVIRSWPVMVGGMGVGGIPFASRGDSP